MQAHSASGDMRNKSAADFEEFRRKMEIDEADGDDTQTLDMLEAEQTFSECEDNEIATQQISSKPTGVLGNIIPPKRY